MQHIAAFDIDLRVRHHAKRVGGKGRDCAGKAGAGEHLGIAHVCRRKDVCRRAVENALPQNAGRPELRHHTKAGRRLELAHDLAESILKAPSREQNDGLPAQAGRTCGTPVARTFVSLSGLCPHLPMDALPSSAWKGVRNRTGLARILRSIA